MESEQRLDVPTGQTRPAAGPTTSPLLPTGFPASPVDSVPLDSQPGTPLPSLTSDVLVPIGNNPTSVFETPTGQESTSPLLPVDAPPGPEVGTADSDNGLGPFSRLYDGEGFSEFRPLGFHPRLPAVIRPRHTHPGAV